MEMLDAIIQSIVNSNEAIDALDKRTKKTNKLICLGLIGCSVFIYKFTKIMKAQNIQISELKKELEEKLKGE